MEERELVHYLPIVTTVLAVPFATSLFRRYRARGGKHHLWWGIGVACFGLGTLFESAITLNGNTPVTNKLWYVAGALLGAYPLAQGSAHLLMKERTVRVSTWLTLPLVVVLSALVLASPTLETQLETHRPGGAALGWAWVRYFTPFVNVYAVLILAGGAAVSAWRYVRARQEPWKAAGNTLIMVGAILPAVGGGMAKAGAVEALYVAELLGLALIWAGYACCVR